MSGEQKDKYQLTNETVQGSSVAKLTSSQPCVLMDSIQSLTSLSKQIEIICGRGYFTTAKAALEPLSSGVLWANLDKTKESWIW